MRDVVVLGLGCAAVALGFLAYLLVTSRRRANQAPFSAELPVPPEVKAAVFGKEAAAPPAERRPEAPAQVPADAEAAPEAAAPLAHRPLSPGSHVPLVDALVGLDLPCDLVFLSNVQPEPEVREVLAFVTTTHEPEVVATRVADELERLGYALVPAGEHVLQASRPDGSFTVAVHAPAGMVQRGKDKAFPTAPPAGVVVELSRR